MKKFAQDLEFMDVTRIEYGEYGNYVLVSVKSVENNSTSGLWSTKLTLYTVNGNEIEVYSTPRDNLEILGHEDFSLRKKNKDE